MVAFLYGPREHHGVRSVDELLQKQRASLAKKQRAGMRFAVHESLVPVVAHVSANSWVVLCQCGAGCAADPAWPVACCFGCGAVHRRVVFPPDVAAVERTLLERTHPATRHWLPGETVDDLRAQNRVIAAGQGRA